MYFNQQAQQNDSPDKRFLDSSKAVDVALFLITLSASTFLAITTGLFVYSSIEGMFSPSLSLFQQQLAKNVTIIIMYLIIDYGLSSLIQYYHEEQHKLNVEEDYVKNRTDYEKIKGRFDSRRVFLSSIWWFLVFRIMATTTSSLWASPELSELITEDSNDKFYVTAIQQRDSLQRIKIIEAKAFNKSLVDSREDRIKLANKQATEKIDKAINNGDYYQRLSYKEEGFGWIANKNNEDQKDQDYAKSIRKAMKEAKQMIEKEEAKEIESFADINTLLNDTIHNKLVAGLTKAGDGEIIRYKKQTARRTNYFYLFDIIAGIILFFGIKLRVMRRIAGNAPSPKRHFASTLSSAMDKNYQNFLGWLEDFLQVDLDGNGTIGSVTRWNWPWFKKNAPVNQATIGFKQFGLSGAGLTGSNAGSSNSGPVGSNVVNQATKAARPSTSEPSRPVVQQQKQQNEPTVPDQVNHQNGSSGSTKEENGETVLIINHDERYLRSKCKQAYQRSKTQEDPTTPLRNYDRFSKQLTALGYDIYEIETKGKPDLRYIKDGTEY